MTLEQDLRPANCRHNWLEVCINDSLLQSQGDGTPYKILRESGCKSHTIGHVVVLQVVNSEHGTTKCKVHTVVKIVRWSVKVCLVGKVIQAQ